MNKNELCVVYLATKKVPYHLAMYGTIKTYHICRRHCPTVESSVTDLRWYVIAVQMYMYFSTSYGFYSRTVKQA